MTKKPSEIWKEYLHEMKGLDKAAHESLQTYLHKYAKDDKEHTRKEKADDKYFIAGKIYSFMYTTSDTPSKERPIINRRPILLSFGQLINASNNKLYEVGIDLMLVPPKIRMFIFDNFYKIFKKDIQENIKNIEEGRKGKKKSKLTYENAKSIFNKLGWQMAFSTFDKTNIAKSSIYDYEDWVSIISLYNNGITGKQPKEIYENYIKRITNPPELNINESMKTNKERTAELKKKETI